MALKHTKGWIHATWNLAYLEALRENRQIVVLYKTDWRKRQGKLF